MEEQFLNDLGEYLVDLIRQEIDDPNRARYSKSPRLPKNPPKYKVNATGALKQSVSYVVRDNEIDILMNDYGVNNVFNPTESGGAKPRPIGARSSRSALISALIPWAQAKFGVPPAKAKSIAFAVRKNLFKSGYGGVPLFTEDFQAKVENQIDRLLENPNYLEGLSNEFVDGLIDRINLFGKADYNLLFGGE